MENMNMKILLNIVVISGALLMTLPVVAQEVTLKSGAYARFGAEPYPILMEDKNGCYLVGYIEATSPGQNKVTVHKRSCMEGGKPVNEPVSLKGHVGGTVEMNTMTHEKVNFVPVESIVTLSDN